MRLATFASYVLPTQKDEPEVTGQYQDAYQTMQEGDGAMLTTGTAPLFLAPAAISLTFIITAGGYLALRGFPKTFGGLESALIGFSDNVLNAGLQTLTDTVPSGTTNGLGGLTVTSRTCTAIASGNYAIRRIAGAIACEIDMTFLVPSGKWTLNLSGGSTTQIDLV